MTDNQEKHKKDHHYKLAKVEGYRARSAYKLLDIQRKFNIFKRAYYILDLGSAPGSWLQVAKQYAEKNLRLYNDQYYHRNNFKIMGIDVKHIRTIENIKIIKMDLSTPEFQKEIETFYEDKLDLIISDASINKTGNKFTDQLAQVRLCFKILEIAKKNLKTKGSLLLKAFQGPDFNEILSIMKDQYLSVKIFKPQSSKRQSNEMYLIGLNKN
jgi:23S rRNA (uridine2552-2'-O)-methyltransferase